MLPIIKELSHIFCCPPLPSHIAAKLAFLPPIPTYSIISNNNTRIKIKFHETSNWPADESVSDHLDVFYVMTSRESRIICIYISINAIGKLLPNNMIMRNSGNPIWTVLFSHGNAVDIGQMAWFLVAFAAQFNVNVICYDYSGYGLSSGKTLESNLYADAEAVLQYLIDKYKINYDSIILYGQSIGTAPTVHLATKYNVAGVVLHSALMSGMSVICPGSKWRPCFDPFANIDKVDKIKSPTLIIHGEEDEMIGINHGMQLHSKLKYPLEPAWVKDAGHNNIEESPDYIARLQKFFEKDLKTNSCNKNGVIKTDNRDVVSSSRPWGSSRKNGEINTAYADENSTLKGSDINQSNDICLKPSQNNYVNSNDRSNTEKPEEDEIV